MRLTTREYLLATVAYADIFRYPLTGDDLYFWCIKKTPAKSYLMSHIRGVSEQDFYRYMRGRKDIFRSYFSRRNASKKKWEIARAASSMLQYIPTLQLVGVTGGVAVNNASARDDIDLFFITARGTLWISRLCVTIFLDLLGLRRKPDCKNITNRICINMFMSEEFMTISKSEQDLFSAHEVLQMTPIWSRRDMYWRFLQANAWVKTYLPVAWNIKKNGRNQHSKISHWYTYVARQVLRICEIPAKYFQLWYMQGRRTNEVITSGVLRFHPRDARVWIKSALAKRLTKYNIPLDNIFYDR